MFARSAPQTGLWRVGARLLPGEQTAKVPTRVGTLAVCSPGRSLAPTLHNPVWPAVRANMPLDAALEFLRGKASEPKRRKAAKRNEICTQELENEKATS